MERKKLTKENIMKDIGKNRIKTTHRKYINDEINFYEYYDFVNRTINKIRWSYGLPQYGEKQFELLWDNLGLSNESWNHAKKELFLAIES